MSSPLPKRRRTVGISLKLYFSHQKTIEYVDSLSSLAPHALSQKVDVFVIPDLVSLTSTSASLQQNAPTILLGAQDCFWEDSGAYTGEVSPKVLKEIGCSIVELGHAERRKLFGETDETVARKAAAVERNSMIPLVCIGEVHRGSVDQAVSECKKQVESVLSANEGEVWFAYEPVWAIGQKEPAEPGYVKSVVKGLRNLCGGRETRWLYGGSAGVGTFGGLKSNQKEDGAEEVEDGLDGLFLGRFGHDIERVKEIIQEVGS